MGDFLIKVILDALIWLIIVPAVTDQRVKINGGFLSAVWISFVVCFVHYLLWVVVTVLTVGLALFLQVLTFGLIGVIITAAAIHLAADLAPNMLHVRGGTFWAALTLVVLNAAINYAMHTPGALQ